jgi:Asp-tRNA(Asn)/Glu-tRNA(Gln) amidotransferase A subunit family amidase
VGAGVRPALCTLRSLYTLIDVRDDMRPPICLTLTQWLGASRETRARALQACLDRIRDTDDAIRAWVHVLPQPPTGEGPLTGIPFGAKDIIETGGVSTEYGSPIYKGRVGVEDAAIVRDLRQRGAVLLGKTQTTAFAWRTPSPTRNPRNVHHTPGGSSSGSAAAVALGMVPFALGTQTLGSVLRPASYCGVTGFKPSYGALPMDGVLPCAPSLDTLGLFTHGAADMVALWDGMGHTVEALAAVTLGAPDRIPDIEPEMSAAFQAALTALRRAGVSIEPIDIGDRLLTLRAAARTILAYEAARVHEARFREHGDAMQDMADLVREGLETPGEAYAGARRDVAESRGWMSAQFARTPVVLVPAATGPAPRGLTSTGDPAMNAPWTALGTPAISIPMPVAGLPLGLQLTADHAEDSTLLRTAARVQRLLERHV